MSSPPTTKIEDQRTAVHSLDLGMREERDYWKVDPTSDPGNTVQHGLQQDAAAV